MRSCPNEAELLRLALIRESPVHSSDPAAGHVTGCVRCQRELAELREAAVRLGDPEEPVPEISSGCLDDADIAALAEGLAGGNLHDVALDHLARCGACRSRVASLSRLLQTEEVQAEVRRLEAPGRAGRRLRIAGGLAAAAALIAIVRTIAFPTRENITLREESMTLISAPMPVRPTGIVARIDSLTWRSVPRATQYRMTLFSEEGATIWETGTTDTVVAMPSRVQVAPGQVLYWKVEARTDWNRWTASEMVKIRIGGNQ